LLQLLKAGDPSAAQPLWELYFRRLVALARRKLLLHGAPRQVADEEDVVLHAFDSLCRGAAQGRFPHLGDRNDLRWLLFKLTAEKAARLTRDMHCIKRGGGKVPSEADILDRALSKAPPPEFAAQMADECRKLLHELGDDDLRRIALLMMEGYTVEEIATRLDVAPRTVSRKLAQMRNCLGMKG
jgi:DNA-directed RNA polymerase specialized sigma24 family protein